MAKSQELWQIKTPELQLKQGREQCAESTKSEGTQGKWTSKTYSMDSTTRGAHQRHTAMPLAAIMRAMTCYSGVQAYQD